MNGINSYISSGGSGGPFSGDWVLLDTQTASSSATLNFTGSVDNSTYLKYLFYLSNIKPTSDNTTLEFLVSTDNGVSYLSTGYYYAFFFNLSTGSGGSGGASNDSTFDLSRGRGNNTGEGNSGLLNFYPSEDLTKSYQSYTYQMAGVDNTPNVNNQMGGGYHNTSSEINAFRFKFLTGQIASGTIKMYGMLI